MPLIKPRTRGKQSVRHIVAARSRERTRRCSPTRSSSVSRPTTCSIRSSTPCSARTRSSWPGATEHPESFVPPSEHRHEAIAADAAGSRRICARAGDAEPTALSAPRGVKDSGGEASCCAGSSHDARTGRDADRGGVGVRGDSTPIPYRIDDPFLRLIELREARSRSGSCVVRLRDAVVHDAILRARRCSTSVAGHRRVSRTRPSRSVSRAPAYRTPSDGDAVARARRGASRTTTGRAPSRRGSRFRSAASTPA